jgi:copper chaperone
MSKMEKVSIQVTGMSCAHCELRLKTSLERIPGVKEAVASAKNEVVQVSYDIDKTDIDHIREAILDCGYTPD